METEIRTDKEGVHTVYQKDKLVAIIKREQKTGHHLVYLTSEAKSDDIADLLKKTNGTISPSTEIIGA
jgi:hypothetical protein